MKHFRTLVFLFLFSAIQYSCISNKKLIYMQDLASNEMVSQAGELKSHKAEEYQLQYNDVVDISIRTTSPEINLIFNDPATINQTRMMGGGMMNGGDIFFLTGYTLDDDGKVELPMIGEVSLVGLSTKQAKEKIESSLKNYISEDDYYVRVRLGGIRYSALGEFNRPGKYTLLQNRVTIYEAIANAGEMTPVAKRNGVVLVRQYPDGSRAHRINLINKKLMESEVYFLRPNDLIYAEPMKVRELGTGITFMQTFQLAVTTLTLALLFYNSSQ